MTINEAIKKIKAEVKETEKNMLKDYKSPLSDKVFNNEELKKLTNEEKISELLDIECFDTYDSLYHSQGYWNGLKTALDFLEQIK